MLAAVQLPEHAPPQEKYLLKPHLGSSHHWALSLLTPIVAGKRVLDIGAGGGGMGRILRSHGASYLVAIELDARARKDLTPSSGVTQGDTVGAAYDFAYETVTPVKDQQFDVILMLDVLEHMSDPFQYLRHVQHLLAPGGCALISIPNVAHWSVRIPLLFGRFEYASRGLLDRTHLQLFTRERFKALLTAADECRTESVSSSIEPVELMVPRWFSENALFRAAAVFRRAVAIRLPGLMAYQHLGVLRSNKR
jgi:2-polyprenyl-3-methyl-5-hydroxy-6-metoxy-1,4-benzoquinol methylase